MVKDLAEKHIRWVWGNGEMDFWHENGMGPGPMYDKVENIGVHPVANFVNYDRWSINLLQQWLPRGIFPKILRIVPPVSWPPDRTQWDF